MEVVFVGPRRTQTKKKVMSVCNDPFGPHGDMNTLVESNVVYDRRLTTAESTVNGMCGERGNRRRLFTP